MPNIAEVIASLTIRDGGATMSLSGARPADGFMVGGIVPSRILSSFTEAGIAQAISDFAAIPAAQNAFIGTWLDGTNLYIDLSERAETLVEALALAHERDELAVWDVANAVEVRL